MRKFDVVVIGAGIGGGSLTYNLLKQGFTGSILVVDQGETVAAGATSHSAGGFRNLYTTDINMKISNKGIQILRRFKEDMGMAIGFQQNGYLFTYYAEEWKQMPGVAAILEANKVNFSLLTPAQVEARIPGLLCGVDHIDPEVREALGMQPLAGGLFGADCGSFDPSQACAGYFERAGTDFQVKPDVQLNTQAVEVLFDQAGRATGVRLKTAGGEEQVEAGIVALCTGPWTNKLLRASRFPAEDLMPIIAQKRMLFMSDFPDNDPRWQDIPLTSIDQGIFFKFESGSLMIGKAQDRRPRQPGHHLRTPVLHRRDQPGHAGAHAHRRQVQAQERLGPPLRLQHGRPQRHRRLARAPPGPAAAGGLQRPRRPAGSVRGPLPGRTGGARRVPDHRLQSLPLEPVPGERSGHGSLHPLTPALSLPAGGELHCGLLILRPSGSP